MEHTSQDGDESEYEHGVDPLVPDYDVRVTGELTRLGNPFFTSSVSRD
jgi:hypothetical protein